MTEKQIKQKFKETYPDYMRGDEPLSPYFDIWEYAIEIVTSEMQEKFDKRLKRHCNAIHSLVDELERRQNAEKELDRRAKIISGQAKKIQELIKQNMKIQEDTQKFKAQYHELCHLKDIRIAELDCQMKRNIYCYSCKNATKVCFKNEIGCPCEKYKSYKDENAELKEQQFSLRNERNTFLAQNEQYEKDLIDFNENLTKAKEIIKKYLAIGVGGKITQNYLDVTKEAEQFLKECK